jgi:exopolyphosphatase/guanosine-5'-triphosphate,3'-diphosphate pyrophosphatase
MPAAKQYVAVDLGSNSFHMLIARVDRGHLQVIDRIRDRVQLAAGLDEHNNLTAEAQARALRCLTKFAERIATVPQARVRAVGTNTLRKARNALGFVEQAERALGHPIEIISGHEEARLIDLGVAHTQADGQVRRLVVDIGGGSTECIIGEGLEALDTESVHIGCVSQSLRFFGDGKIRREAFREAVTAARLEFETFERRYRKMGWVTAFGCSGTVTTIGEILAAYGHGERGITREGLRWLRDQLVTAGRTTKLALQGLSAERAPVVPGGLAILIAAFKGLKIETMVPSTGALREGLLYDTLGANTDHDARAIAIERLMTRYGIDAHQARRVELTALNGFDQVAEAWALHHPELRRMLGWSARLHEIGLALSYSGHHHHGAYIVAHSEIPGFSRRWQLLLAALIRAHRRRFRPAVTDELEQYGGISAIRLAVLLRLAATLHRSRDPAAQPAPRWTAAANTIELSFPHGWLAARPLTSADLTNEQRYLRAAGFNLVLC